MTTFPESHQHLLDADIADDDYAFARKVGAKYGGVDLSEHDSPGDSRVIVTIEPTNVYAVDMRIGQM